MPRTNPASPNVRLVVFDLGRVLIRICNDWTEACHRAGVEIPSEPLDTAANLALHELACQSDVGKADLEQFITGASPILRLAPDQVRRLSNAYLHAAFPGGIELVEDLHARGLSTACLSNTNDNHWRIMNDPAEAAHFPLHRLTHRFASHLVGARKPDAAIYAHLERETGFAPGEILFFDDLPENIAAARVRGWMGYHVDPKSENPIPAIRGELKRLQVLR